MIYQNSPLGKPLSVIALGGAALSGEGGGYGFGPMDETQAEKLLKEIWQSGVNLFDTAPIYGFGLSEQRLGKYLPREAIIVTKAGVDWHPTGRVNMTNDPKVVEKMLRESLKRLKREMIDIYMIHWPDKNVDIRRSMEVLVRYQEKGVLRHLGLCNTNLVDLKLSQEIGQIEFIQGELNVLKTQAFDLLGEEWKKYFSMGWGTLDKGILSGRVHEGRKFDPSDARSWAPWWNKKEVAIKIQNVQKLKTILEDYEISLTQFCLQYNLNHYGISSCLIGVKSMSDFIEVNSNLHQRISNEIMEEVFNRWKG